MRFKGAIQCGCMTDKNLSKPRNKNDGDDTKRSWISFKLGIVSDPERPVHFPIFPLYVVIMSSMHLSSGVFSIKNNQYLCMKDVIDEKLA